MIRTVVAHHATLVRNGIVGLLSTEDDIHLLAALGRARDVEVAVQAQRPDVAVLDSELMGPAGFELMGLVTTPEPRQPAGHRGVLVLAELRRAGTLAPVLRRSRPGFGFLAMERAPERLAEAVRRLARGEPVIDDDLVSAARRTQNPFTSREAEVLALAAAGGGCGDIATGLSLSPGTIRNYLSRILTKTGARTRLEAVRMAERAGWI